MATIAHRLVIRTNPSIVYKAITTQEGLSDWWTVHTSAKPEIGHLNTFSFMDGAWTPKFRVIDLVSDERVRWRCEDGDQEWIGTEVEFLLIPDGDNTVLHFEHSAWREATPFFASCNYNWGFYMRSLKKRCETGKGNPHPEDRI